MAHAESRYFGCSNCGIVDCRLVEGSHRCESQPYQRVVLYMRFIIMSIKAKRLHKVGLNVNADGSQDTC